MINYSSCHKIPKIGFLVLFLFCLYSKASVAEEFAHVSHHKNMTGIFVGITGKVRRDKSPTMGFEYERLITSNFGVGGTLEYASGDLDFTIIALPFAYHQGRWKYVLAPGIEKSDSHGKEALLRLGIEYAFEFDGGWELAPKMNIDFVDGHQVAVLGVVFAKVF
ncbi:MAG: hypothetical protein HRU20_31740 [Pseudomonadales bacterium]|nr:hypothetical protein [Pseudomonadales bacterium]